MENNEDKAKTPSEPKVSATPPPPRKPVSSSTKWIAVIVALLVVIGVLGGLLATHYYVPPAGPTGPSAMISTTNGTIQQNQTYSTTINATGTFQNMTVYYGDGASQLINYSNSNSVKVSHQYANPGQYYILGLINYSSSNQGYYLSKVTVAPNLTLAQNGYRPWVLNPDSSSTQLYSPISNILSPGSSMQLNAGGFDQPNYVYQIIQQSLTMNNLSGQVSQQSIPYYYNYGNGVYTAPVTSTSYSNMMAGMYMLNITTKSALVNGPQSVTTTVANSQTQMVHVSLGSPASTFYAFNGGSTIVGTGSQNLTFGLSNANVTYGMGDNATFMYGLSLNLTSGTNLTLISGSASYVLGTGPSISINGTNPATNYTVVPSGAQVIIGTGAQVVFNSAASGYLYSNINHQSFTGNYTLGFSTPTPVMIINHAAGVSPVTYNAGTSFTSLNGTTMSVGKTNVTFAPTTSALLGQSTDVVMTTAGNVSSTGNVYNASGILTANATTHTYFLNAGENYTFASNANVTFNTAATSLMIDTSATSMELSGDMNAMFTLVNTTKATFTSMGANTQVWTSVTVNTVLTGTGSVSLTNGNYNPNDITTTYYYEDFPVTPKVTQEGGASAASVFTNAEPNAPGGYTTLDPSLAYYTADSEVLNNALLQLDTYNGSSTSNFVPQAAAYLPSTTNGGINYGPSGYSNYTKTTPWGTTYAVNITPGENYTFYINNKTVFNNGAKLSAWDVMYTFTRTLLFDAGSPGTGGWVIAQYLLPGDYFSSNTFYNITQNITVNNASNSITFHFQTPMPASLVFQIFASSGTWIEPANWFIAHGAGISWTPAGFENYKSEGNIANYNTYIQNHIMADGPYMISYIIPGSQVTMVKNPNYVAPNNYFRAGTIDTINLLYLSSNEQAYLLLKSGQATQASLPTSYWNETQAMVKAGQIAKYGFPTLSLYFYTFTQNTNLSLLGSVTSQANLPSNLFENPNVRKAFAYAYNYSIYYNRQVGNQIYNTTFLSPYAGMLPAGMLYNQSLADLSAAGAQVINGGNGLQPFQLAQSQKYWGIFMNSTGTDGPSAMGISTSAGKVVFNGKPLSVPIMIPNSDPTDKAAVTTWGSDIAQVISGATAFPVELPLTDIFASYAIPGQNPMAISWGGWAPDYPYPTDYLLPMGMPLNSSTYMGPAGYTPYVVGNSSASVYNLSEAAFMQAELSALNNATNNATNPAAAEHWFHVANEMIVNSTIQVYIGQRYLYWTFNSKVNGNDVLAYQQNIMIGGGQDLQYNLMSYNTTS